MRSQRIIRERLLIRCILTLSFTAAVATSVSYGETLADIAEIAKGWRGEIIAEVNQTFAGWDIEIGDADNDGQDEVLTTGCPDSRLYLFKKVDGRWETRMLAENLAQVYPGMGLVVKVVDLNGDGKNEVVVGTGQEGGNPPPYLYILQTDGYKITKKLQYRSPENKSGYTHNLAFGDLDNDGILEITSAYCGNGENIRYDVDRNLTVITSRKIYHASGSGEESWLKDVDNDGKIEYITSNSSRANAGQIEIFEIDDKGELILPPRIIIDGYDGKKCYYCSLEIGDVDNDGKNELIIGWDKVKRDCMGTLLGYRVDQKGAIPIYTFAYEDNTMDNGYFEKTMSIGDADNDGRNELVTGTDGEHEPTFGGRGMAHVFMFEVADAPDGTKRIRRTLLANFDRGKAESTWTAIGDIDHDGKNEVAICTANGYRRGVPFHEVGKTKPDRSSWRSHVVLLEKEP